jgi:hypothetical protein
MEQIDLWLILLLTNAIFITIASASFLIQAFKKRELKSVSRYSYSFALFFMIVSINGFLDFFQQYFYYKLDRPTLFPESMQVLPGGVTNFYIIISLLHLSYAILSYQVETYVIQKEKAIFSWILMGCFVVSLLAYFGPLFSEEIQIYLVYVVNGTLLPFGLIIFSWGIFYLKIGFKGVGIVKRKALMVAFGLGGLMIGIISDTGYREFCNANGLEIIWIIPIMFKMMCLIAIPLLYFGFHREE